MAMTIAAGGLIMMASNAAGLEISSSDDQQLHYAAEAGMQMGIRWTRNYLPSRFTPPQAYWLPENEDVEISKDASGNFGYVPIDGKQVRVVIRRTPPPNYANHMLKVFAKDDGKPGVLEINVWITLVAASTDPGCISVPSLAIWRETYHPDGI